MTTIRRNFWVLRQNYCEKTDQEQMKQLILSQKFVTCPWGGWGSAKQNVLDGVYNANHVDCVGGRGSSGQDRRFVEEMKCGDIVLIPFAKKHGCILARIVSDVALVATGMYWTETSAHIKISEQGDSPFCPLGRRIEIIDENYVPRRVTNHMSLSKMSANIIADLPYV